MLQNLIVQKTIFIEIKKAQNAPNTKGVKTRRSKYVGVQIGKFKIKE